MFLRFQITILYPCFFKYIENLKIMILPIIEVNFAWYFYQIFNFSLAKLFKIDLRANSDYFSIKVLSYYSIKLGLFLLNYFQLIFKSYFIKKNFNESANYEINVHNRVFINRWGENLINWSKGVKHYRVILGF